MAGVPTGYRGGAPSGRRFGAEPGVARARVEAWSWGAEHGRHRVEQWRSAAGATAPGDGEVWRAKPTLDKGEGFNRLLLPYV